MKLKVIRKVLDGHDGLSAELKRAPMSGVSRCSNFKFTLSPLIRCLDLLSAFALHLPKMSELPKRESNQQGTGPSADSHCSQLTI
jgi:hypothetical protein